jgi:hypothetical protein
MTGSRDAVGLRDGVSRAENRARAGRTPLPQAEGRIQSLGIARATRLCSEDRANALPPRALRYVRLAIIGLYFWVSGGVP